METGVYEDDPLEPYVLLPEQFAPLLAAPASPEFQLMVALLIDGIASYLKNKNKNTRMARQLYQEDVEWFRSTDTRWPFSFENISAALGLDAQAVREWLFRKDSPSQMPKTRLMNYSRIRML